MNRVVLIGRLTREVDLRFTPNGHAVARFGLAVPGRTEGDVNFVEVVAWRKLAETCAEHLTKGRMVGISGHLSIRRYETADGEPKRSTEVVAEDVRFLDKKQATEEERRLAGS